jgi:hypothetical protein
VAASPTAAGSAAAGSAAAPLVEADDLGAGRGTAPASTNGRPPAAAGFAKRAGSGFEAGSGGSAGSAVVPASTDLAIPGYDSLSASQVVQRLAGLAPPELEAVRTYEAGGRGRRTVLTKISQLQTGRS